MCTLVEKEYQTRFLSRTEFDFDTPMFGVHSHCRQWLIFTDESIRASVLPALLYFGCDLFLYSDSGLTMIVQGVVYL